MRLVNAFGPVAGRRVRRGAAMLAGLAASLVLWTCAVNPVTGQRQFVLMTEGQEIAMGREYDPQITAELGLYPDSALQAYVHELGTRMAAASERPHLPWTFRVLDDPLVNAFALPGGFIYVPRGILAHFNSEAELAAVIGHEIGHVTARHSVSRLSTQQLAQLGLAVGTVLRPELELAAGLAGAGLGILFLKHGRDDERQADDLGLRYMVHAGYDPHQMPGIFSMLEAVGEASGGTRAPEWLATHPNPGNRRERILEQIAALPDGPGERRVGREEFLRLIDGMVFGENPREGFFRNNRFDHPDLRFRFTFPDGWTTANQKQAVLAVSPGRDAVVQITLARQPTPDAAAREFLGQQGITPGRSARGRINGFPAVEAEFAASTDGGPVRGHVAFLQDDDRVYRILAYAAQARWPGYEAAALRAIRSFERLTDAASLAVQPLRIEIVRLPRAMTLEQFAREYPSPLPLAQLALLNGVAADARLDGGSMVKRVVGQVP
jgi:predicted Zn-dependent protease